MFKSKSIFLLFVIFALTAKLAQAQECTITTDKNGETTDDCPSLYTCVENECKHKDIFPLTFREVIGALCIMILSGFANSGGIGGGSILTPILLTIFGYSANKAIMLVYVLIFGGSLGNFLNVAFQRDVKTGKPIILYDFALIITPIMLLGSNIGVLLNRMIAPAITICGLLYLVSNTLGKIWGRAKTSYAKETQALESPLLPEKATAGSPQKPEQVIELRSPHEAEEYRQDAETNELKQILEEENQYLPKSKITFLGYVVGFVLIGLVLRGSDKFQSILGLDYCSFGYWFAFLLILGGCYHFYTKGTEIVKEKTALKARHGYSQQEFNLNEENILKIRSLGALAGVLGALLGIGGGMILGAPMLGMGIGPQSMTATCGLFVVLTSFVNLVQAFLYGGISMQEIIFFFLVSSIGSYMVSSGITMMVNKYKRPSLLLFVLSGIMGITLVVLPIFTIYKTISNPGQMLQFHGPC